MALYDYFSRGLDALVDTQEARYAVNPNTPQTRDGSAGVSQDVGPMSYFTQPMVLAGVAVVVLLLIILVAKR